MAVQGDDIVVFNYALDGDEMKIDKIELKKAWQW